MIENKTDKRWTITKENKLSDINSLKNINSDVIEWDLECLRSIEINNEEKRALKKMHMLDHITNLFIAFILGAVISQFASEGYTVFLFWFASIATFLNLEFTGMRDKKGKSKEIHPVVLTFSNGDTLSVLANKRELDKLNGFVDQYVENNNELVPRIERSLSRDEQERLLESRRTDAIAGALIMSLAPFIIFSIISVPLILSSMITYAVLLTTLSFVIGFLVYKILRKKIKSKSIEEHLKEGEVLN